MHFFNGLAVYFSDGFLVCFFHWWVDKWFISLTD